MGSQALGWLFSAVFSPLSLTVTSEEALKPLCGERMGWIKLGCPVLRTAAFPVPGLYPAGCYPEASPSW